MTDPTPAPTADTSGSILDMTKKVLGIDPTYTAFDLDITMHINSALFNLMQLGVGPVAGFSIEDNTQTWGQFLGGNYMVNAVRTYVYLKVRTIFDPPTVPSVMTAFEKQIAELEWRLNIESENIKLKNTPVGMVPGDDIFRDERGSRFQLGDILIDPNTGDIWRDY